MPSQNNVFKIKKSYKQSRHYNTVIMDRETILADISHSPEKLWTCYTSENLKRKNKILEKKVCDPLIRWRKRILNMLNQPFEAYHLLSFVNNFKSILWDWFATMTQATPCKMHLGRTFLYIASRTLIFVLLLKPIKNNEAWSMHWVTQ